MLLWGGYTVETLIQNDWSNDMLHQEWMKYGMYCDDVDLMAQLRDYVDSWGDGRGNLHV